ncbi:hypothetical protein CA13_32720 [Planctomycetes bacterium CA13]|uniref:Uncharacterized protein n=1 Tax=Novipirellula herctigrandis TaxID=2527986 RepID=A0A5C5Z355_9BACT|nr:hypothetical protein CA13_32720 [Planctomycetes bacterium CA13]
MTSQNALRLAFVQRGFLATNLIATVIVAASIGCGDDSAAKEILTRKACLAEIESSYRSYQQQNGEPPKDQQVFVDSLSLETETNEEGNTAQDELRSRLMEGDFIVMYGGKLSDQKTDDANTILAFEAGVPGSGGYVVYGDGNVQHIHAKVFAESTTLSTE